MAQYGAASLLLCAGQARLLALRSQGCLLLPLLEQAQEAEAPWILWQEQSLSGCRLPPTHLPAVVEAPRLRHSVG